MFKCILIVVFFLLLNKLSYSQDTLPEVSVTSISKKVLISWTNPFTSVTNIIIQRSPDSLKNFKTIGSVLNVKSKTNGFSDNNEFSTPQYYRVLTTFEGGTYMFSQSHKPGTELPKAVSEIQETYEPRDFPNLKKIPPIPPPIVKNIFVPSKMVYTGKENNVIISLQNVEKKKYTIKFFEPDGTFLFELKKINEPLLTLDKVNFIHAGLFNFELYADGSLIEKHQVYIPKDGQPMPALDVSGRELK
jgi:hypothetical protein